MTTSAEPAPQHPFDVRPLIEPVDRRAVRRFDREMRRRYGISLLTEVILWIVFDLIVVGLCGWIYLDVTRDSPQTASGTAIVLALLAMGLISIPLIAAAVNRRPERAYRVSQFAAANGMTYLHELKDPALPGMIFQHGNLRKGSMLVRGEHPRFVEFGNYEYETGSGKHRRTHTWGYVAVKLDVPLPNIVLDALGNNSLGTNLPAAFDRDQQLSLEGDFDRYFGLYCPRGYEADALYLFTPDIMARLIDHAAQLDVEIVDDWMFLYMQRDASTVDVATWAWLFATVGALLAKLDQWARWRDDRMRVVPAAQHPLSSAPAPTSAPPPLPFATPVGVIPPPGVANPGRRLEKRFNWARLSVFGGGVGVIVVLVLLIALIDLAGS